MNPQDLQNRYFEGYNRNPVLETENRPVDVSLGKILMMVFVLVGLMLFAFYMGVIEPLLRPKKQEKPEDAPKPETEPIVIQFLSNDEAMPAKRAPIDAENLQDRWRENMSGYGLLEEVKLNGHRLGEELTGSHPDSDEDLPNSPEGEGK